ncbi:MAG: phage tail tape measure protein, partial [Hymenobacter sp.]
GKLGISGERDVLGFVKAANQIGVALGNSLGNTEDAINDLGKLTDIFKIKDTYGLETALLKTGSAITDLGNAGTANEGYLVEFTKRMGGIAPAANISIQDILGLATAMDELGQPVEASATAIGQFVMGMGKDIPKFARIAGMGVQEFTNLLKTDGNQALLAVLKNVKSTGEGIAGMAENMGMVGEEGARAVSALGVLSNNLDTVTQRQALANESFAKGSSLTDAYNEKNENFAATVDKLGKSFNALTSNTTLTDFFTKVVVVATSAVTWLNRNMEVIGAFFKAVLVATTAIITYNTVRAISIVLEKEWWRQLMLNNEMARLALIGDSAWSIVKLTLTGRIREARAELAALNSVMKGSPWGLILAGVAAAITAYMLYSKTVTEAEKVQRTINDVEAAAAKSVVDQTSKLQMLQKALTDKTKTHEQQLNIIKQIRDINPDILKGLSDEEALTKKGTDAINNYVKALEKKATAEAVGEKIKELKKANIDLASQPVTNDDISIGQDFAAFAT